MDNHSTCGENRDLKILSISSSSLDSNLQSTSDELGQTAATKLSAAIGSVLSDRHKNATSFSCFQLLMPMAAHPSNWIWF